MVDLIDFSEKHKVEVLTRYDEITRSRVIRVARGEHAVVRLFDPLIFLYALDSDIEKVLDDMVADLEMCIQDSRKIHSI